MVDIGGQIGTRSVLFTDLVGSTELRVRLGEEATDALRRAHDAVLAEAVTSNGGTVVKGLGDGLMVTFGSAAEAVAAGVAVQQAVESHGRRDVAQAFAVRVGISIGDVSTEEDDVFGVPVVEAARLCAAAGGGEVLVAEHVRALARGRGGFSFEPMGELKLKGLPDPVSACRVLWEPVLEAVPDQRGEQVPISPALVGPLATSYVGRESLRGRLTDGWQAVRRGACRTVLLAGEPGVGKTRTAAELARTAFADGALILFGRCDEALGVPYQPFVEALQYLVVHATSPALGRTPGELRRLVPDLGKSVDERDGPVTSDPASEEHRLFEACASWLIEASRSNNAGCVLVLDDVHWATKPTLQLLQHVVRSAADDGAPLLVVATYRDTEIDDVHPLAAAVGDLRRLPGVDRVAVDNLSADEVVAFIAAAAGHELDDAARRLADAVSAETEGNPFFVGEVLRHLIETGGVRREGERWVVADPDHVAIPEGVRDVVGRRLTRLSSATNEILSVAAVVGREFDVDVLIGMIDITDDAALDALDEAVRARLVEETAVDRFRFAHALVRTTLHDELSATRRRRLHCRVADVLEKLRPHDVRALAYHCTEGVSGGGDIARALGYTLAAAAEALAARAFAEAEARFRAALELLDDVVGGPERVVAMCGLGECMRDQGDATFREVLLDASRRALELGDVDLVVRAVLANTRGYAAVVGAIDPERIEVTEQALALVGPFPSQHRSRLLGHLASELTFSGDHERRLALSDESVAMARAMGDDRLLAGVLVATSYAYSSGGRAEAMVERNRETVRLADVGGDPALQVLARLFFGAALLTTGKLESSAAATREMVAIADAECPPIIRWTAGANSIRLLSLAGALDDADRFNDEMLALATELGQRDGEQWWAGTLVGHAWLRGDAGPLADAAAVFADQYPLAPAWRTLHAWALTEAGRLDEARAVIGDHGLDPAGLIVDPLPFVANFQLALAAFRLGDDELGARVVAALAPHRHVWAHYFLFAMGPVTWALGLARAAMGNDDQAIADLDEALAALVEHGLTAHLPTIRLQLAEVLTRRGAEGDIERASALLATARQEAVTIGAPTIVSKVDALVGAPRQQ